MKARPPIIRTWSDAIIADNFAGGGGGSIMGGRDHIYECEQCGHERGGLNNTPCDCDMHGLTDWLEREERLRTLAANLATGGGAVQDVL